MKTVGGRASSSSLVRLVAGGLTALVVPPLLAGTVLSAMTEGIDGVGVLIAAGIVAVSAAVSYRIAGAHPYLLGLLAGEAVTINSLFLSDGVLGMVVAVVFGLGPGLAGAWWGKREWGEPAPAPPPAPLLAIGGAAAVALLVFNVAFRSDPQATLWADFPVGAHPGAAMQTCGSLPGVTSAQRADPARGPVVLEPGTPLLRFVVDHDAAAIDDLRGCVHAHGATGSLVSHP